MAPLQRLGEADDIGWAALFLASRQASYITGQSLAIGNGACSSKIQQEVQVSGRL